MKRSILVGAAFASVVAQPSVNGYDLNTHANLSAAAANQSVLNKDQKTLQNLGLLRPIDDSAQNFPNARGDIGTVLDLIQDGARSEDDNIRVVWHFFNPVTGLGLYGTTPSPDWALEDRAV